MTRQGSRIRTVKPSMHSDGTSGRLSDTAFRLLIGLLNFSDDVGVNLLDVGEIHAKIFPYKKSETGTEKALAELVGSGMTKHFTLGNGKSYVYIVNFLKHQRVDRPSQPMIDGWEPNETFEEYQGRTEQPTLFDEPSTSPRRALDEPSPRKGGDSKGKERTTPSERVSILDMQRLGDYCGSAHIVVAILEELDDYVASSGKHYKDIPATVRSWFRRKRDEGSLPKTPQAHTQEPQGPKEKPTWVKPPPEVKSAIEGLTKGMTMPGGEE